MASPSTMRSRCCARRRRWARCGTSASPAAPPEYKGNADAYVDLVCEQIIPASVGLADAVDGFCEGIGFSPEQIARVFDAAQAAGLPVKLHAEQLSHLAGASLAAS